MLTETLFTEQTTIKISVVKLDNQKLTKSIFNQLNILSAFDDTYNIKENAKFLGYVNEKMRFYLWTNGSSIYKYEIKELYRFLNLDLEKCTINNLVSIFPSEQVEYLYSYKNENGDYEYKNLEALSVLDKKEQYEILEKKENLTKIVREIIKRQIFI